LNFHDFVFYVYVFKYRYLEQILLNQPDFLNTVSLAESVKSEFYNK